MLGPGAGLFMSALLFLYIWGSSVSLRPLASLACNGCWTQYLLAVQQPGPSALQAAYLIILGDCLQPLLVELLGGPAWFTQRGVIIAATSCVFIFPLCLPHTLAALAGAHPLHKAAPWRPSSRQHAQRSSSHHRGTLMLQVSAPSLSTASCLWCRAWCTAACRF